MASNAGKGDARRPGAGYAEGWDAIFSTPNATGKCPRCNENVGKCVCCPTEDGPGQEDSHQVGNSHQADSHQPGRDEASQEVKTNYERRRFNREGV